MMASVLTAAQVLQLLTCGATLVAVLLVWHFDIRPGQMDNTKSTIPVEIPPASVPGGPMPSAGAITSVEYTFGIDQVPRMTIQAIATDDMVEWAKDGLLRMDTVR